MLAFQGPAQPSPALGEALNAGYRYLEVKCLGCETHQTVALDICSTTEVDADSRARALHAVQAVLSIKRLASLDISMSQASSSLMMLPMRYGSKDHIQLSFRILGAHWLGAPKPSVMLESNWARPTLPHLRTPSSS
ncbi:hypothetical protein JOH48_008118 [Bradyrhizobium elkanii]|nr:hypothetical protein [Bradyrhizobium elkanii]